MAGIKVALGIELWGLHSEILDEPSLRRTVLFQRRLHAVFLMRDIEIVPVLDAERLIKGRLCLPEAFKTQCGLRHAVLWVERESTLSISVSLHTAITTKGRLPVSLLGQIPAINYLHLDLPAPPRRSCPVESAKLEEGKGEWCPAEDMCDSESR